ncbi:MAG: hypothetical protein RL516_227 [Bacteroidota bacterium]|jgi:hypothetical protein
MKYKFTLLFVVLFFGAVQAQINLVPNPSFEDTVYCPPGRNHLKACKNWLNFGNSPDYFNACTPFSLPNSNPGFQYAHTGNAYAGALFFRRANLPSGPNYREPMAVELVSSLIIGQKYYVSFFAVNAEVNFASMACDKLGVNFYTVPFDSSSPPPLINTAKLYSDSILTDTLNWTKISGSFIADSAYQYLCISNFFNDANTDTLATSPFPSEAFYYIDDVCLSTDSLYNETWTGINHPIKDSLVISIYPNPSKGFLNVESPIPITNYSIYNIQGQLMNKVKVNTASSFEINLSNNLNGMYFLQIQTAKGISNYKIILTQQ